MVWNKVILDTKEKAIECINKTTWKGVQSKGMLSDKKYEKGIQVTVSQIDFINRHIIREKGLEKWSIVITPFAN